MVYVTEWNEFQRRCIQLYQKSPERARYLIKARPSTHQLVLKVTDDVTTLKFRTRSSVILGRFEVFNKVIMAAMAGDENAHTLFNPTPVPDSTAMTSVQASSQPASAAATAATASGGATTSSAAKKKKAKK